MDEIESVIESLQEKRNLCREKYEKEEQKQIEDYDVLMKQAKDLQKECVQYQESISKNFVNLISKKLSIQKLLHNSEQIPGLPISYDCHQKAIQLFSDAADFMNAFTTFDGPLDILQSDDIDQTLTNDIAKCSNNIQNEFYKTKSAILHIEKAKENIEILSKLSFESNDESGELNPSGS